VAQLNNASRVDLGDGVRFGGVVMDDKARYVEASFTGRVWDSVSSNNNYAGRSLRVGGRCRFG
jgi:hypothetical protein